MASKTIEELSSFEPQGQWRLFTQEDFEETLGHWKPSDTISFGTWNDKKIKQGGHIHVGRDFMEKAIARLRKHVKTLKFHHGKEGKIPRANKDRPYRLVCNGALIAVIALKASEAFNSCEVDVFLAAELPGMTAFESTRAALLFAFSDATKSAGSLAIQFSKNCAANGVPENVRILANKAGVKLRHIDKGTLSPDEARELFLYCCGLSKQAQMRVIDFSQRCFFSIERICYLITQGLWSTHEADIVLLTSPFPDLILGAGVNDLNRHLAAHAMVHAKIAILSGLFDQALRLIQPALGQDEFSEHVRYLNIKRQVDPEKLVVTHGPLTEKITLQRWTAVGDKPLLLPKKTYVVTFIKPRRKEEIRVFLLNDIEEAGSFAKQNNTIVHLIYPDDYRQLAEKERIEANHVATEHGVRIIACPESVAGLEDEFRRRLRVGRTVRQ